MTIRQFALAVFMTATTFGSTAAPVGQPAASSCLIQPDKLTPIRPGVGRVVYCGLDLGSRTAKLSVLSMEPGRGQTITDERQCKRTLGMGALVFDSKTGVAKPLPDASITDLIDTVNEYRDICARDGGQVVATGATQWARDATNISDVTTRVAAATSLQLTVLTPAQEAEYAYVAASVGAAGRIVVDPGSNSFELAWQERGSRVINSVLVPYGYVRGAVNDVEPAATFGAGRAAYQATARRLLEEHLARLSPAMSLEALRRLVSKGSIGPEIIALGQDGAMHLSVRGILRTTGGWINTAAGYDDVLRRPTPVVDEAFGRMSATPLRRAELSSYLAALSATDFATLKSEPVRSLYGQKALVAPALADLLMRELGATRVVLVPQELTTGHILASLLTR